MPFAPRSYRSQISQSWMTTAIVFFAYVLLSVAMTWPLVLHFTTKVISGGDNTQLIWNYWWVKHAIVDMKVNPFYTDYLFYPNRTGLVLDAIVFLNGFFSSPLQYFLPLPAIYNLAVLLSFSISGFGVYLLAGRFIKEKRAAFMAGVVFASFRSTVLFHNIAMTQWVPFYLFFC